MQDDRTMVGERVPQAAEGIEATLRDARAALAGWRDRTLQDPFTSPIKLLAQRFEQQLDEGTLDEAGLEALVARLTGEAAVARALRLRRYLGELGFAANDRAILALIRAQSVGPDGARLPFEAFAAIVERVHYGFVFTAHPTFSLAASVQRRMLAFAEDAGADPVAAAAELGAVPHRPDAPLDLAHEHARSVEAAHNLRAAVLRLLRLTVDVAADLYPERWTELAPRLVSVASWVGYDTDGRSDIPWSTTFAKRLLLKADQLEHYRHRVADLRTAAAADDAMVSVLELLEVRLSVAWRACLDEAAVFESVPSQPPVAIDLARTSQAMLRAGGTRLVRVSQLADLIERALGLARDEVLKRELVVLRAELATMGLALARTHLRINALQLHNAIRKQIGLEYPPDDPGHRRSYVEAIALLIDEAVPVAVNFGSVEDERATARRAFMTMTQMLKLVDADEPIRFLIAECETGFTLLTALYYARLYGIDRRIDLSPLFETRVALERGPGVIAEALGVDAYRETLRARGRLCIQTGFSDAGRYLGQLAAAGAIEQLRLGLISVLQNAGLADIELVIFDTHGESVGRGCHPSSFADRLGYQDTAESRRRLAAAGITFCQETSYQGGDGYLYFLSERSAYAVLARTLETMLTPPPDVDDPFYDGTGYVEEFMAAIEQFNARVIADPAYAALLSAFGTNLLFRTGSRPVLRQFDGSGPKPALEHPSQIRAIPHNAILQQLGFLANTLGGVGQAVAKNPDRFHDLYRHSLRFRRLMTMVEHAFQFTDLDVLRAYLELFDPATWLRHAARARGAGEREEAVAVATQIDRLHLHDRLRSIDRTFSRDHLELAAALRRHRRQTRDEGITPIAVDPETRDAIHLLHALRLALIARIMRRAVHVPDFSDRHGVTHDGMIAGLLQLDVEPALAMLGRIFPMTEAERPALDWGEPAGGGENGTLSYAHEHRTLLRPIAAEYDLARRIGTALSHYVGAVG